VSGVRLTIPDPPPTDGVVLLRPPARGDVPAIVEACSGGELARWLPRLPDPYGVADAEWWIGAMADGWREGGEIAFAIEDLETGRMVGAIGASPEQRLLGAELGWWLAPHVQGRGLMTRALRLATRWAFEEAGLPRLQALIRPSNDRSIAVAERAGFRREGLLRRALDDRGTARDVLVYGLLPGDSSP
jgi:RimJ/RimL family protein N-acetyltransferase